ncbi:carbohydrate ABC transporter permease [Paenibacillus cellulositrophicus]|uniref:carbohydrate ABC transporter permease n=1 Tax=Paenibacillus cellulositrophicus TaxID=562959 RepID=UPI0012670CA5|nr:carbohydrate ABC transporter permease [Paenibacillus cellulositrophicus]
MVKNRTPADVLCDSLIYFLLGCIFLITIYPFWNQVVTALSSKQEEAITLLPKGLSFGSFLLSLDYPGLWSGYRNTILRTVCGVLLGTTVTALLAYPLAKAQLPFNRFFTALVLFTMLFSGGLIPNYLLIKSLGLINTFWALILPGLTGAFNVFIMRNFFRSLPDSLEESAQIDGAGYFSIFTKIILPISSPVLATVSLWIAVAHWNAWFDSMIYIQDPHKQVLQVILRKIIIENNLNDMERMTQGVPLKDLFSTKQLQATVICLSVIPMLIVYPFVQKYFVKGIMVGAVKG